MAALVYGQDGLDWQTAPGWMATKAKIKQNKHRTVLQRYLSSLNSWPA